MKKLKALFLITISAALLVLQSGCAGESESDRLAAAKSSLKKNDPKTATIHLKQILEQNPSSVEARLLLGKVLLESGNPVAAEVELQKARDLAAPAARWAPLLAKARLQQYQLQKVIDDFGELKLGETAAQADLNASVAAALAAAGQQDQAIKLIDSTLGLLPTHPPTLMLKARLLSRPDTMGEAIALVDKVLAADPGNTEAWQLNGDLHLYGRNDTGKASAAYLKVLELRPDFMQAHSALIMIQLSKSDLPGARSRLETMAKALPGHPQTKYMDAKITFLGGDAARARELVQQLLGALPNNIKLLELAGSIELKLNSLQQAEAYLNKALSQNRDLPATRQMLADVLMRNGKPAKALEVLAPNTAPGRADPLSLSLAAEAYLQLGNIDKAEEFFRQASKNAPNDPRYQTAIALAHLAKGQSETAIAELRNIATSTQDTLPDLSLINALIRRQKFDLALQSIEGLERKQPTKALAGYLRGRVQLMQRDLSGARKSFASALEKDPVYMPAIVSLAAIDQAEGKLQQAESRYEAVLKIDPRNAGAYMALAEMKGRSDSNKELVVQLLDKAIQANSTDPAPRLMLVRHWLTQHNPKAALAAAQSGLAAMPENPEMLDALGSIQLAAGEVNQSIATFSKIAAKFPNSTKANLRLADAHLQGKDQAAAEKSFKRVLEISPENISAQRGIIALSMRSKQPERALEVARNIQKQRPNDIVGNLLEGDIHVQFKAWEPAIKAYRSGLDKPNPKPLAERLYAATVAGKGKAEAQKFVDEWMKGHPNDSQFLVFLGSNSINLNELTDAEKFFADAIKLNPQSPSALNNLAWLKAKLRKPGAVALAEKALALAPDEPAFMDTLSFALAAENQLPKAIEIGKLVVANMPNEPVYKLNLAKLYVQSGDKERARVELQQLVPLGPKFARQPEVSELLKAL